MCFRKIIEKEQLKTEPCGLFQHSTVLHFPPQKNLKKKTIKLSDF
jgi:hypothetical protein